MGANRIIWARWRLRPDGSVEVVATLPGDSGPRQEQRNYESLEAAARDLGASFADVVGRAVEAGSHRGRWRP